MTDKELLEIANDAMERAYAPYSGFKVGAALLSEDGRCFSGCNVENASFGAAICAERNAMTSAVSCGCTSVSRIAIVSSGGGFTYPCGICRQFLSEFTDGDGTVILCDREKGVKEIPFRELFPFPFDKSSLNE
ncbi:MAG: cytidine deaminase [Butyrivibrio sp.]|nr:cytidine deaminase [Butyrivibrio sp.]